MTEQQKKPPIWLVAIFIGVIAVCCIGVVVNIGDGDDPVDPVVDDRSTMAEVMCEEFIERRLKAPATAEYTDPETSKNGATYTVTGAVDAENSFGAKIRLDYICTVTDGGEEWKLVNLVMPE